MRNPDAPQYIVLVERDDALRAALQFAFEMEGYAVSGYPDAETALAGPAAAPACFVLDHNLAHMTWRELLERLRAQGAAAPAVLIASTPSAATRAQARAVSVEIVEKPLIGGELSDAVRRALGAQMA